MVFRVAVAEEVVDGVNGAFEVAVSCVAGLVEQSVVTGGDEVHGGVRNRLVGSGWVACLDDNRTLRTVNSDRCKFMERLKARLQGVMLVGRSEGMLLRSF